MYSSTIILIVIFILSPVFIRAEISNPYQEERSEFSEKLRNAFNRLEGGIQKIRLKLVEDGDNIGEDIKIGYEEMIITIRKQNEKLKEKLDEIDNNSDKKWKNYRKNTQNWWKELKLKLKKLNEKLQDHLSK